MNNLCFNCMQDKGENVEICPNCGYKNEKGQQEHYYLQTGITLNDRYIVGRVLGHGGFGITYIGLDTKLDAKVAIKEYLPGEISTRALGETTITTFSGEKHDEYVYGLGRFIDEAKTLAKYNSHQCIVSVNDYFEENGTAYIVMEYLDGISLSEYIKRSGGKIPLDETLEIIRPVMDALCEVHLQGMIHRDVSPDNIFVTKNNQIKLLDFGAARHAISEKSKSLSVVLKPGYAPPEQYYTKGKQGPWTDVYAVAATMYKCITGNIPPEAMERMVDDNLSMPYGIDNRYSCVLVKALNPKVSERYTNVNEFMNELYNIVQYPQNAHSMPSFGGANTTGNMNNNVAANNKTVYRPQGGNYNQQQPLENLQQNIGKVINNIPGMNMQTDDKEIKALKTLYIVLSVFFAIGIITSLVNIIRIINPNNYYEFNGPLGVLLTLVSYGLMVFYATILAKFYKVLFLQQEFKDIYLSNLKKYIIFNLCVFGINMLIMLIQNTHYMGFGPAFGVVVASILAAVPGYAVLIIFHKKTISKFTSEVNENNQDVGYNNVV